MTGCAQLGDLVTFRKGKKAIQVYDDRVDGSRPYIQIDEVRGSAPERFAWDPKGVEVKPFDICIVWDGANAGTVGYGVDGLIGSTVTRLRLLNRDEWDTRFVGRLLQSKFVELNGHAQARGATIPHVDKTRLEAIQLPLIPKHEQERIAAILDRADAVSRKRAQALAMLDRFLKSLFAHMFGDLEPNTLGWETYSIAEVLRTDPQNGLYRPARDYGSGIYILRIDGFYEGYLDRQNSLKRLRIDAGTIAKYRLEEGDIIINRVNSREYLGKSALIEGLEEDMVFESNMMRFCVDDRRINPRFLVDQLQTPFIKRQILRAAKDAVNQSSINQTDVKELRIRVPPIDAQNKYAAIVQKKTKSGKLFEDALQGSHNLFRGLAQRAFRGEL